MAALLISTSIVKARMVMPPELLGADPAIKSAIKAAQMRIEAELDTGLQARDHSDLFFTNREWFGGVIPPGNLWRLFLKNGFLREEPVVEYASSMSGPFSEATLGVEVDKVRGIVYLDAHRYSNRYVRVTYRAGYADDEDDVPAWLAEAILGYTPLLFKLGPAADSQKGESYKDSAEHAQAMLSRYQRNVGLVFRAIC